MGFLLVQPFSHVVDLVGEQTSDVFNLQPFDCMLTWTLYLVDKHQRNWLLAI